MQRGFSRSFRNPKGAHTLEPGTALLDSGRKSDQYCDKVRPFDDLIFDLMSWKFEKQRREMRT